MNRLVRWFVPKREKDVYISRKLWAELASAKPGGVTMIADGEGNELAIMHRDDFEHIAGLAGLRVKQSPTKADSP